MVIRRNNIANSIVMYISTHPLPRTMYNYSYTPPRTPAQHFDPDLSHSNPNPFRGQRLYCKPRATPSRAGTFVGSARGVLPCLRARIDGKVTTVDVVTPNSRDHLNVEHGIPDPKAPVDSAQSTLNNYRRPPIRFDVLRKFIVE